MKLLVSLFFLIASFEFCLANEKVSKVRAKKRMHMDLGKELGKIEKRKKGAVEKRLMAYCSQKPSKPINLILKK